MSEIDYRAEWARLTAELSNPVAWVLAKQYADRTVAGDRAQDPAWCRAAVEQYTAHVRLVHLQFVGRVPGVPAEELRVGDQVMWNSGSKSTVTAITPKGAQSLAVQFDNGARPRTLRRSTIVAGLRDNAWMGRSPAK